MTGVLCTRKLKKAVPEMPAVMRLLQLLLLGIGCTAE